MNLIKLYGELKYEQAYLIEMIEYHAYNCSEEKLTKSYDKFHRVESLIDKVEDKLSEKYNIEF